MGRAAARRAIQVAGNGSLSRSPLVVELEPEPSMAAGRLPQGPGDWFCAVVPEADLVRLAEVTVDEVLARANGRQLVILARDAHRHSWEREAVEKLVDSSDDAIVVELGLPYWKPSRAAGYVTSLGAARVNIEAVAERLSASTRSR